MSVLIAKDGTEFGVTSSRIEVTSLHRPDTAWSFADAAGHVHQWHTLEGLVANNYEPSVRYFTPTLDHVIDHVVVDEGGEEYPVYRYECKGCREVVERGFCADANQQFVRGIDRCSINGVNVSMEEFQRRLKLAFPDVAW